MSEDIQGGAVPPRREAPLEDDDYGPDSEFLTAAPFPGTVLAAGVIWIVYGCLVFLDLVVVLLAIFAVAANAKGDAAGAVVAGTLCGLAFVGLIGAAFLFVGVQSVRGTARDTLGNGVGSIILGLLGLGGVALYASLGQFIPAGGAAVGGGLLLTAGVLALVGRSPYKLWRMAQRDQQDREREERRAHRRQRMEP